ncbi:MAG: zinc-ribbon domain-containing protein [Candidatus Pacearchaeota archaeon]|jgi:hypothetical protein
MFKKKCPRCEKKIEKEFDFCPYCGANLKSRYDDDDYGILGKNDFINKDTNSMLNFGGSFLDKMINNAMKMIEKQMQELPEGFEENMKRTQPKTTSNMRIRFMVNGKEIPIRQANESQRTKINNTEEKKPVKLTEQQTKQLAKLPRKEPKTTMKRLSGKLIYELAVPGVSNIKDIIINKLENSIEIKAISKDKIYSKNLNVNLQILRYSLEDENIILELKAK